jgi:hypothetical protein
MSRRLPGKGESRVVGQQRGLAVAWHALRSGGRPGRLGALLLCWSSHTVISPNDEVPNARSEAPFQ